MHILSAPRKGCQKEAIIRFGPLKVKETLTFEGSKNPVVIVILLNLLTVWMQRLTKTAAETVKNVSV